MILLPNFRLPNLIHTRSANSKWLYEISHANPIWVHPQDAARIGVETGALVRVETEIGWFVDKVWVTEGIKPGIVAMSHHLGRWRLQDDLGGNKGTSALAQLAEDSRADTSSGSSAPRRDEHRCRHVAHLVDRRGRPEPHPCRAARPTERRALLAQKVVLIRRKPGGRPATSSSHEVAKVARWLRSRVGGRRERTASAARTG